MHDGDARVELTESPGDVFAQIPEAQGVVFADIHRPEAIDDQPGEVVPLGVGQPPGVRDLGQPQELLAQPHGAREATLEERPRLV